MRIEELRLHRVGPFVDRHLTFPPPGKLAIIYGQNEAGKSTTLRALIALLFGFARNTSNLAFGFDPKHIRIGAVISAGGTTLEIERQKRGMNSLTDANGVAMEETLLSAMMGGVAQDFFEKTFALDQTRLREGGEALRKSGGAFLASVLNAHQRGLTHLHTTLAAAADAIYVPKTPGKGQNTHKRFYQAQRARKDALERLQNAVLGQDAWREAVDAVANAQAARQRAQSNVRLAQSALAMAQRAAVTAPIMAQMEKIRSEHCPKTGDYSRLQALETAVEALRNARRNARNAQLLTTEADSDLARARQPGQALAHSASIAALDALRDASLAAERGEAERRARKRHLKDQWRAALRDCGLPDDVSDMRILTASEAADFENLAASGLMLFARRDAAFEKTADATPPDSDVLEQCRDLWRDAISASAAHQVAEKIATHAAATRRQLAAALQELAFVSGEISEKIERLAQNPVPPDSVFDRFNSALGELDAMVRHFENERTHSENAAADAAQKIETLNQVRRAPSAAELGDARKKRDAKWREICDHSHAPLQSERAAFEIDMRGADNIADQRFEAAAHLSELETAIYNKEQAETAAAQAKEQLRNTIRRRQEVEAEWAAYWPFLDHPPAEPQTMRNWATQRAAVLSVAGFLDETEKRAKAALEKAKKAQAAEMALSRMLNAPVGHLEAALNRAEKQHAAAAELRLAEERISQWRQEAASAAAFLSLPRDFTAAAFAAARGAFARLSEIKEALAALQRDQNEAENANLRLADALAALPEITFPKGVSSFAEKAAYWLDQLEDSKRAAEVLATLNAVAIRSKNRKAEADAAMESAQCALSDLLQMPARDNDLEQLAEREIKTLRKAWERDSKLQELSAQLVLAAPHHTEATLRAEFAQLTEHGVTIDTLSTEIAQYEAAALAAQDQVDESHKNLGDASRRRQFLADGELGPADHAAQEHADAIAALQQAASDWAPLKIASVLLEVSSQRFRNRVGAPFLNRASQHFKRLTGGRFERLQLERRGQTDEQITAIRAHGAPDPVTIAQMSAGTQDQLFLSHRLAAIEQWVSTDQCPPFVGDDLLTSYDDERMTFALETLAEFSFQVQTVLFTHHRHVVDRAQDRLKDKVAVLAL